VYRAGLCPYRLLHRLMMPSPPSLFFRHIPISNPTSFESPQAAAYEAGTGREAKRTIGKRRREKDNHGCQFTNFWARIDIHYGRPTSFAWVLFIIYSLIACLLCVLTSHCWLRHACILQMPKK
jgi:hypothetical protein